MKEITNEIVDEFIRMNLDKDVEIVSIERNEKPNDEDESKLDINYEVTLKEGALDKYDTDLDWLAAEFYSEYDCWLFFYEE
jgi:hypothetical protein